MSDLTSMASVDAAYPMCAKLGGVAEDRNTIVAFLEWLSYERGIILGRYNKNDTLLPVYESHQRLAHEFLEIDDKQLEQERRAMLEEIRAAQEAPDA